LLSEKSLVDTTREPAAPSDRRDLIEIGLVFVLILAAIWTPQGRLNSFFSLAAAASVLAIAFTRRFGPRQMGLTQPHAGAWKILLAGAFCCGAIWIAGYALRSFGPGYPIAITRSWQYAIWALVQQFILQSIFFVRLEPRLGAGGAAIWTAILYSFAHLPNPGLTVLSFFGGLIFCELFRRWRNLFPLGLIHAALGLTIAASLPDKWLHHMRVGIGFLSVQHW
jgi:hypothetical protein